MKMKRFLIACVALLCAATQLYAQDGNNTAFLLPNAAHRYRMNAAYQPEYKSVVGIPVLSGINFGYMNNSFGIDEVLFKRSSYECDSLILDVDALRSKMHKDFRIHTNLDMNILSVAFRTGKKSYFSFDVGVKLDAGFGFDKALVDFIAEGNAPYLGSVQSLGGMALDASAYVEAAFGYSRIINDQWTVGGRLKVLFGALDANVKNTQISLESPANGESVLIKSRQEIYLSAPITGIPIGTAMPIEDFFNDIDFDAELMTDAMSNLGFAVDLGATYKFNDDWTFGASVNDLGFINWKSNVYKLVSDDEFNWEGADLSNSVNENDPDYVEVDDAFENMVDSLTSSFTVLASNDSYCRMLNAKVNLHATYHLNKRVNFSALVRGVAMADKFYPSMTLAANVRPVKNLGLSVSYSVYEGNFANIGIGIAPRFGGVQPYLVVDNVLAGNFTHARSASLRFGINFVGAAMFGKRAEKKGNAIAWRAD